MGEAIGDVLPLALGVAISPIPVIAAILMLLSPKAKVTSTGFLLGWVVGIVVAVTAFTLLSSLLPEEDSGSQPIAGTIQLVLGALMVVLAAGQWRKRPGADEEPTMPGWMQAIDKLGFPAAVGIGFLLSALNPKNLLLGAGAGLDLGAAALGTGSTIVVIAIFTVIAASTVAVPVIGYLLAADKLRGALGSLRDWLQRENAVIMAVLLVVIGVSLVGKGLGQF
ncbi:GAP family protein [Nocardioides insulae]|uniref:GAP family protein n=1 Tax=Nocardioides insulae TaxID=394734 RepID=UPI00048DF396|nr:GAP family protein [Nocardioides insulae]